MVILSKWEVKIYLAFIWPEVERERERERARGWIQGILEKQGRS